MSPVRAKPYLVGALLCMSAGTGLSLPSWLGEPKRVVAQETPLDAGAPPAVCDNGLLESGEQCEPRYFTETCRDVDPRFTSGFLECDRATCTFDTSRCRSDGVAMCGDGIVSGAEQCDQPWIGTNGSCAALGFGPPDGVDRPYCLQDACRWNTVTCPGAPTPVCGDGKAESYERCDGTDLRGQRCENVPGRFVYVGGTLLCTNLCIYDTSHCVGPSGETCGNGRIDPGEECDGSIANHSCRERQRLFGRPRCTAQCKLDYAGCWGGCSYTRLGLVCN